MRKFIISDIHGNGNLYYSVMHYLENISKFEEVILYINGDLIDRGIESGEILLDVIRRIKENNKNFRIEYLAGNHELLMYQFYKNKEYLENNPFNHWYENGGWATNYYLEDTLTDKNLLETVNFISKLKIYHKFRECINGRKIVLVHASCPTWICDKCALEIRDDNRIVEKTLWARNVSNSQIGNCNYFTIIGHTPNNNQFGFEYCEGFNYLNIDGGSSMYVSGDFSYDHYPLVEVKDKYLKILTFNNNNEITAGNYFIGNYSVPMPLDKLNMERIYLDKDLKTKKLVKLDDGIIGYNTWK